MSIGERYVTKAEFEAWIKQIEKRLAALEVKEVAVVKLEGWSGDQPFIEDIEVDSEGRVISIRGKALFIRSGLVNDVG